MPIYQQEKIDNPTLQPGTQYFRSGLCKIIVSPPYGKCGWHMSISCDSRDPLWQEIRDAWYTLVPQAADRNGAMFFPPKDEYVNVHKHCFHVHEVPIDLKNCVQL